MLVRREHSEKELYRKLTARGFDADVVCSVLVQLKTENLQSDYRFTEAYVHNRIARGYGPLRIRQELHEKGLAENLIEVFLTEQDSDWMQRLDLVRQKKFGKAKPADYKEQARQSRFLQYRGFSTEQIRRLFKPTEI